jgi:hypothetical protein
VGGRARVVFGGVGLAIVFTSLRATISRLTKMFVVGASTSEPRADDSCPGQLQNPGAFLRRNRTDEAPNMSHISGLTTALT